VGYNAGRLPEHSRRHFLTLTGSAAATLWLADLDVLRAVGRQAATADAFRVLSPADAADLDAAAAQIIPTDDTPGAREAKVVYFMDQALDTFAKDRRAAWVTGARLLRSRAAKTKRGARTFAELTPDLQIAVLASMDKDKVPFFKELRDATVAGMLASPEHGGNFEKIGWKMIGFDDRFVWTAPFGWYDRDA
jgi:gluconate 2-dehydrogenase gamma chain